MATNYRELTINGLWKNNPALVQLLGLCPLLAVTASVVNALSLGIASYVGINRFKFCSFAVFATLFPSAVRLPTSM